MLTALFALRRELEETVKETSDPTIGRTKLAWWQKELAALAAGQPSHPVAKALHAHLRSAEASYPALQTLLAGYGFRTVLALPAERTVPATVCNMKRP